MTWEERADAVAALGFTPRQARFLALAALHSGYCLRRQYGAFAGLQSGKNVQEFFERLEGQGLASRLTGRADRGHVYHLHSRTLYRALGEEHNRNRRPVAPAQITRKLMLLDFVLSRSGAAWYATEREKVALFTVEFGIALAAMPHQVFGSESGQAQTVRFFLNKLPIYVSGDPPRPHFVYLAAAGSANDFDAFLRDHERLFEALGAWTVVVLGARDQRSCNRVFTCFVERGPSNAAVDELRWLFERQHSVDEGDLARISVTDLPRFRELRKRYAAPEHAAAYREWLTTGRLGSSSDAVRPPWKGEVVWEPLHGSYQQFGSLPGVA